MFTLWRLTSDQNCTPQFCTASRQWLNAPTESGIGLLAVVVLLLLTLFPGISKSLGLGNLDVQTYLGQPLRASIELVAVNPGDLDQIKVKLATKRDFDWVGIERTSELEQLRFAPFINKSGIPTIAITTARALERDSLNFLVEVRWPEGRLLREYTIKLEQAIPGFEPTPTEINPPMVQGASKQKTPSPQASEAIGMERTDVESRVSPSPRLDTTLTPPLTNPYTTMRGDTLYKIAHVYLPGGDVNIRQMALALFQANPDAFKNQDINQLKANVPLRIPELNEIKELSRQALSIEKKDQRQESAESQDQTVKKEVPEVSEPKPEGVADTSADSGAGADKPPIYSEPVDTLVAENQNEPQSSENEDTSPQQVAETEAYLEIMTEETQFVEPEPETVNADDFIANLENTVALTQELAESRKQENSELKTRIKELESMISRQERLIALQTTQMGEIHKAAIANAKQSTPEIWQWVLITLIGVTIMLLVLVLRLYRRP